MTITSYQEHINLFSHFLHVILFSDVTFHSIHNIGRMFNWWWNDSLLSKEMIPVFMFLAIPSHILSFWIDTSHWLEIDLSCTMMTKAYWILTLALTKFGNGEITIQLSIYWLRNLAGESCNCLVSWATGIFNYFDILASGIKAAITLRQTLVTLTFLYTDSNPTLPIQVNGKYK